MNTLPAYACAGLLWNSLCHHWSCPPVTPPTGLLAIFRRHTSANRCSCCKGIVQVIYVYLRARADLISAQLLIGPTWTWFALPIIVSLFGVLFRLTALVSVYCQDHYTNLTSSYIEIDLLYLALEQLQILSSPLATLQSSTHCCAASSTTFSPAYFSNSAGVSSFSGNFPLLHVAIAAITSISRQQCSSELLISSNSDSGFEMPSNFCQERCVYGSV